MRKTSVSSRSARSPRDGGLAAISLLAWSSAAFLSACILFGGDQPTRTTPFAFVALTGTWLTALALYRGQGRAILALPLTARLALLAFLLLPLIQLVPLPPATWTALPGRQLAAAAVAQAGGGGAWRPLTLSVPDTLQAAGMFLWLGGFVLAVTQLTTREIRMLLIVLLALGGLHAAIGVLQVVSGGRLLLFYPSTHQRFLIGLFSNKNHSALFIVLMLLAGFALTVPGRLLARRALIVVLPLALVFMVLLLATNSRAGLLLGVLALAMVVGLGWSETGRRIGRPAVGIAAASILVLAAIASSGLAERALGRFAEVGQDPRSEIWAKAWAMAAESWPWGAGLGTFTAVSLTHERLSWVKPTYLNHAHNDYLELLMETGVAAVPFVLLAAAALLLPLRRAWRARSDGRARLALIGAGIVLLCAAHETFDYPLRRMAIAAVFALGWGLLWRHGVPSAAKLRGEAKHARQRAVVDEGAGA